MREILTDDHTLGLDLAIQVAADDAAVAPFAQRVDRRWIDWFTDLYEELGLERVAASSRAVLAYSTYIGFLRLIRTHPELVPGSRRWEYAQYLAQVLLPPHEGD